MLDQANGWRTGELMTDREDTCCVRSGREANVRRISAGQTRLGEKGRTRGGAYGWKTVGERGRV